MSFTLVEIVNVRHYLISINIYMTIKARMFKIFSMPFLNPNGRKMNLEAVDIFQSVSGLLELSEGVSTRGFPI